MTATKPATPGPFRAEGTKIKAVSHGQWFTVADCRLPKFTQEGQEGNAEQFVHAANAYPRLVEDATADLAALEWAATHTDGNAVQFRERIEAKRALLRELGELSP